MHESKTHVLHLFNHESKPSWTGLREAFAVNHEVQKANVEEGVKDTLRRFQQGHALLA